MRLTTQRNTHISVKTTIRVIHASHTEGM
jgi:hypothetical protein